LQLIHLESSEEVDYPYQPSLIDADPERWHAAAAARWGAQRNLRARDLRVVLRRPGRFS
jgi:hypothetical protein